ncbi:MAG TPA: hypothetical protein PK398_00475 [Candidatus Gracilibacteria bacterium]|nr:hypothetical protein [Candidatus Gracilibacteria bacterium]
MYNKTLHPYDDNGEGTCPIVGQACSTRIAADVDMYGGASLPEAVSVKIALEGGVMGEAQEALTDISRMVNGVNMVGVPERIRKESIRIICSKCRAMATSVVGPLEKLDR